MEANPDVVARVLDAGHEIGNHNYSHDRLVRRRPSTIRSEVESTDAVMRAAGVKGEIFMRPPHGARLLGLPWYLWRHGRPVVLWNVEPDSQGRMDSKSILSNALETVGPGSIILYHAETPTRVGSREALRPMVSALLYEGYRFVTLSELTEAAGSANAA